MVKPCIEAHAELFELREPLPEPKNRKKPFWRIPVVSVGRVVIPDGGAPDSPGACRQVRFEYRLHIVAKGKVSMSDDACISVRLSTLEGRYRRQRSGRKVFFA